MSAQNATMCGRCSSEAFAVSPVIQARAVGYFFAAPGLPSERSTLRTTLRRKSYCVVTSLSAISKAPSMTVSRRTGGRP